MLMCVVTKEGQMRERERQEGGGRMGSVFHSVDLSLTLLFWQWTTKKRRRKKRKK